MPMVHGYVIKKVQEVWGERGLKKAVIVLTNSDQVSTTFEHQATRKNPRATSQEIAEETQRLFDNDVALWKDELAQCMENIPGQRVTIPVFVAGRADFGAERRLTGLTRICGKITWLENLWKEMSKIDGFKPIVTVFKELIEERKKADSSVRHILEDKPSDSYLPSLGTMVLVAGTLAGPVGLPVVASLSLASAAGGAVHLYRNGYFGASSFNWFGSNKSKDHQA